MELAQGLAFDEITVDSFVTTAQINALSAPTGLGPNNPPPSGEPTENAFGAFDDIDDLKGFSVIDSSFKGTSGVYRTTFNVVYVNPSDISQTSSTRTFVKRVDMTIWRLSPPAVDTLRHSITMGYFRFN
jgi:hypothetical protein